MPYFKEKINKKKLFWCEIFGHHYQPKRVGRTLEEINRQTPKDDLYLAELLCSYFIVWKCTKCGKIEKTETIPKDRNPFFTAYLEELRESRKRFYGKI